MRKVKSLDDLSIDELRQLLVEKRRKARLEHLEQFRKTGRVVTLASEINATPVDQLSLGSLREQDTSDDQPAEPHRTTRVWDRFLLLIEVAAVIGLFIIIFNGIKILNDLNSQFAQALTPATLTPTPLIVPVVLPSGHTPPDSPGGAHPNEAEIPEHLRPLYQSLAQIPLPTPGPEQAIQIQIPIIDVDAPIVQGDGWEQLKKGVAQHIGSADPGQTGNMILSAHNDVFGEIFRNLDQLKRGDPIVVYTPQHAYTYIVTNIEIVEPTDVEVMANTPNPTVTLISCFPYMVDNQRIIVQASLQDSTK